MKKKSVTIRVNERKEILVRLVENSKPMKKFLSLLDKQIPLAEELRLHICGKNNVEMLLALPKSYVCTTNQLRLSNANNLTHLGELHFTPVKRYFRNYDNDYIKFVSTYDHVPCPVAWYNIEQVPKRLLKKIQNLDEKLVKAYDEVQELREMLEAIIEANRTQLKLLDVIPEAKKYFPNELKYRITDPGLPAIPEQIIVDLRKQL